MSLPSCRGRRAAMAPIPRRGRLFPLLAALVLVPLACDRSPTETPPRKEGLVVSTAAREGIDTVALARLMANARDQGSEAIVILRNGHIVAEDYLGFIDRPIYAMSASKSIVSLAYGFLLADGKLASLDEKVVNTLPGFAGADARKATMTYRQLLTQTAGIDPSRATREDDIELHGMSARCVFAPGTGWQYANGGVDLLADLAGRLAGKKLDVYLDEKLFRPLGITSDSWIKDGQGVPYGAGELAIRPLDLAKIGQAMLDGGKWSGTQVIPAGWVAEVSRISNPYEPRYGLLWWRGAPVLSVGLTQDLLDQWRAYGLSDSTAAALQLLVGRPFDGWTSLHVAIGERLTVPQMSGFEAVLTGDHIPGYRPLSVGPMAYYAALGWLGQQLIIVPDKKLVAVRMRRARTLDYTSPTEMDGYPGFPSDVLALVH